MRISDWSSDVCSSDLAEYCPACEALATRTVPKITHDGLAGYPRATGFLASRAPGHHEDRMQTVAAHCAGARVKNPLFASGIWSIPFLCLQKYLAGAQWRRLSGILSHSGAALGRPRFSPDGVRFRSEEHTSELPSLMRISYAVCGS